MKMSVVQDRPNPAAAARRSHRVVWLAGALVLVALGVAARMAWRGAHYVETDNAYVTGHVHIVSPRINGVVSRVFVTDNQFVREGDPIAELDPTDQRTRIEQIEAQIHSATQQVLRDDAQVVQMRAQVGGAGAQLKQAEAQLRRANQDAERYRQLYGEQMKAVARSELDAAVATQASAAADVDARRKAVEAAAAQVDSVAATRDVDEAQIRVLQTQLKDARQFLEYHTVRAPAAGRVGKRIVEVGIAMQAGQHMAAVVEDKVWVTANFKETQLARLNPGQRVAVIVDALKDRPLVGTLDSFSPASGAQFSMLPPDNATGNFTRIVQRIPVKIALAPADVAALKGRLVPGMSARVEVRVDRSGPVRLADAR
ncbi:secretion protein HlyD [Burkholderia ubonensis]|uniref:Secretion protein HlyD n=3 Tax=Burkholderia TaxID=32008 RepID=A0A1B4PM99_BURCE|nr:secretion protein HlyD [Burkholderia cepacia]AOK21760.1 secretion protein HlyD [Burkholderia ubonensis]KVH80376.1 secretion protein HlyD [Burkholderia ubonensis]KVN77360.1 secretion protein HlyD [Burkholderia ubonensis]KVN92677.1 secretion protein HlyD [Burkholderia ubonensis]